MKVQKKRIELNAYVSNNSEKEIEVNDYITVRGLEYDEKNKNIIVYIPGNKRGIIPYKEASIFPYKFSKKEFIKIPIQIYHLINSNFKVKVIEKSDDDRIIVSRKIVQKEFIANLKINEVIDAEITEITKFGLFVNLGERVTAFLPIEEVSIVRTKDLRKWFSKRETIKVKIIEISHELEPIKIVVSRKVLYADPCYKKGDIIDVKVGKRHDNISYFVEINPGCNGIMDVCNVSTSELYESQIVTAIVKRKRSQGKYTLDMLPL